VTSRISDSLGFAHLWGTAELRAVFDEPARVQGWLDVIAALARAQAAEGLIPVEAATAITAHARVDLLDLAEIGEQTRATGHSTLGLIRVFQAVLPESAREHVYAHATVQDVTDTWTGLALRRVGAVLRRDLTEARRRGYAVNRGESEVGVISVAAPIRDVTGRVVAAISVAGPAERLEPFELRLAQTTMECAAMISRRHGFRGTVSAV